MRSINIYTDRLDIHKIALQTALNNSKYGGVRHREVERRPCNHKVASSNHWSECQLYYDCSFAHTFGASTGGSI